jgi:DNA polymerase-3 subunit beta
MKFVIPTQELNYLMNKVQHIVNVKPTMPILANLLIEARDDKITITATDLSVSILCYAENKVLEEGATTLPARKLAQLIKELTAPSVEISTNANDITTIMAGSSRFKLNGMKASQFPSLPDFSQIHPLQFKQKELKDLLYRIAFAVLREDNRYVLTGVLMSVNNAQATFVGTDGKRLAKTHILIDAPASFTNQSIIPLKAVEEIIKNLSDENEVTLSLMADKVLFEANQTRLWAKLLSGNYPEIDLVIPTSSRFTVSLHREELTSLLRQISLFIAKSHQSIRFVFTNGELHLTANSTDIGEGHVGMPVDYHGEKFEIAFNPGFFIDILRHCKEEIITLGLTDAYNPGIITDGAVTSPLQQASPLFIIMPMALSEK